MIVTHQNVSHSLDPTGTPSSAPLNWKGIGIAVLVIGVILSLVILSINLLTPEGEAPNPRPGLTLDDLWDPKFQIHDPEVQWMNSDTVTMRTPEGHLVKQNVTSREVTTLLENRIFVSLKATRFKVSPDLLYVLLASNVTEVYRHSYTAIYSVCSVDTRSCSQLQVPGAGVAPLQSAGWGAHSSQLVYITENNIYYQQSATSVTHRLTSSGTEGVIFNGIADWLYEEEVLGTSAAHWGSADGVWLAFLRINDTLVPNMEIPRFLGQLYPRARTYPYPKMGQPLPSVSLLVVNLSEPAYPLQLRPPDAFRSSEFYITMCSWVSNTGLAVRWLNRAQNLSLLTWCEVTTGVCVERHQTSSGAWLRKQGDRPLFSPDGSTFFLMVPGHRGGPREFWHLSRFTAGAQGTGQESRFITSGDFDVTSLLAYDEGSQQIYFQSSEESPWTRHLYSADLRGSFHRRCLTCGLLPDCSRPRVHFNSALTHFLLFCDGSGVPTHSVHRTADPRDSFLLSDNQPLGAAVLTRQMPVTRFHTLTTQTGGPREQLRPLLLIMDEDPCGQCPGEQRRLDWVSVMASERGVLVVRVGGQGRRDWRPAALDGTEQLRALEVLLKLESVDGRRVGVYGKGFGGYLALKVLALTDGLVRCGVAVSPITDFRLQAASFSEGYLGLSQPQEGSWLRASVLGDVERMRGRRLLLAHGTADTTVHFQHTAELIKELVNTETNYTLQVYPDADHFFRTEGHSRHLQKTVVGFFQDCFSGSERRAGAV